MNRTIWKFPLQVTDKQQVEMPQGAEILCVQVQHGTPCLWALVDAEQGPVKRVIYVYGTGHPFTNQGTYVGTFQVHGGALIFHVFDGGTYVG